MREVFRLFRLARLGLARLALGSSSSLVVWVEAGSAVARLRLPLYRCTTVRLYNVVHSVAVYYSVALVATTIALYTTTVL